MDHFFSLLYVKFNPGFGRHFQRPNALFSNFQNVKNFFTFFFLRFFFVFGCCSAEAQTCVWTTISIVSRDYIFCKAVDMSIAIRVCAVLRVYYALCAYEPPMRFFPSKLQMRLKDDADF